MRISGPRKLLNLALAIAGVFLAFADVALSADGGKPDYAKLKREHWAYQPLHRADVPSVKDVAWARGDIDRFILAKLESKQLKPVADADRAALVRRLYYDLTGLLPTPEQIDAFVSDPSTGSVDRLVDELLASPRFGERWGRHWLDVVRYGESLTLRGFVLPNVWKYRDYVIDAFNTDRPFNEVIQEHVAGDLMHEDSVAHKQRAMTATTFLAIGNSNLEEQDKKALEMDMADEQLDTIGKAFLGQTIGCARCHDHKFDPIPTADYYAMAGILRNVQVVEHANLSKWIEVPLPEEAEVESKLVAQEAAISNLKSKISEARAAIAKADEKDGDKPKRGSKPLVVAVKDVRGIVVDDEAATKVGYWKPSKSIDTYVGAGYVHDDDGGKGERSLTFTPDFPEAARYEVRLSYQSGKNRATNVPITILSEDGERTVTLNEREKPTIDSRFASLGVFRFAKGSQGYVLVSNEGTDGVVVADAVQFLPEKEAKSAGASSLTTEATMVATLEGELEKLTQAGPKRRTVLSIVESKEIADIPIHIRGTTHLLGDVVPRGFLSCVPVQHPPKIPSDQSGRLQLGQWLVHPENPLPSRVMANRVWMWLMGDGIVPTVDNFGTTGEPPSHPELLDYLATKFVAENWSVKRLVREIVLSRTYQLASSDDAASRAIDPENRLRWRAERRRMDAECIRDAMLQVSGKLDLTPGGPTAPVDRQSDYGYEHTDRRRSVYTAIFRNELPQIFEVFDFADPSMVVGKRNVGTVAQQALYLMNHPFPREQAGLAASRLLKQTDPNEATRLSRACRLVLSREPTEPERTVLTKFLETSDDEQSAWTQVFHALFASPDFRYVN